MVHNLSENARIIYSYICKWDFFPTNATIDEPISMHERYIALKELVDADLIRGRNCEGDAYERIP